MVLCMGVTMAQEPVKKTTNNQAKTERVDAAKTTKSETAAKKQCDGKCANKQGCCQKAQANGQQQCQKAQANGQQQCQKACDKKEQPKTGAVKAEQPKSAPATKRVDTKQSVKK